MSQPDPTAAEERRAAEEHLIADRNAAQHAAEGDGSEERVLIMPPEGYAVPPEERDSDDDLPESPSPT